MDDIILAVSSPPGRSARGLIRASGTGAFTLLARIRGADSSKSATTDRRAAQFDRIRLADGELPVTRLTFPGPDSYTGEDVFELLMPGNPHLLEFVIDALIDDAAQIGLHARRAEPGEFTARAYFNRKLTLTEAEGINASIAAQSDAELRAARLLTSGALGEFAHQLADRIAHALALVEAGIDFTDEEDVVAIAPDQLAEELAGAASLIDRQLSHAVGFEELQAIPWVVIVGPPNAGKSTLFNALLGRERAIVSDVPGTTRDILSEPLTIDTPEGTAEVMLVDVAGLDETNLDLMNVEMQRASRDAIERAELLLECVPAGETTSSTEKHPVETRPVATIPVRTKADLETVPPSVGTIAVSALRGEGLDELRDAIARRLSDRAVSLAADALALRPRHEAALRSAHAHIGETIRLVEPARSERALPAPEIVASCMRAALDDLAALAGDVTPDDILGRIFASFCIGK